jgi:transposase-like protein
MRICPTCQRTYPDDNQNNCAYDGTQLSAPYYPQPGQYQPQPYGTQPYGAPPYGTPPGVNPMMPPTPPPGYPPQGGWQGYPAPAYQGGEASPYVPCPQCRRPNPEKVGFTWWGGVLGPRMLSHVKCQSCGTAYNGKTGQSNTTGIVIYSVVLFVIVIAIVLAITLAR